MEHSPQDLIKHREIVFRPLHPDPFQAQTAALLLDGFPGVMSLEVVSPILLQVSYDVRHLTLPAIEAALHEVGLHLDNTLFLKVKRALYHYTEETQRANLGLDRGCERCVQLFINRYQRMDHSCRDHRPDHWRKYF